MRYAAGGKRETNCSAHTHNLPWTAEKIGHRQSLIRNITNHQQNVQNKSFDINQSLPKDFYKPSAITPVSTISRHDMKKPEQHSTNVELQMSRIRTLPKEAQWLARNENSISFSSCGSWRSYLNASMSNTNHHDSVGGHWKGQIYIADARTGVANKSFLAGTTKSVMNPNKAVLCLDSTGKVLTCNSMALQLFEFVPSQITELNFYQDILRDKKDLKIGSIDGKGMEAIGEVELCPDKTADNIGVLVNGEVVDLETASGKTLTVSLWMKDIDSAGMVAEETNSNESLAKCLSVGNRLAIMEPVEQIVGHIVISDDGGIVKLDQNSKLIFQCGDGSLKQKLASSEDRVPITNLLPNFDVSLLDTLKQQRQDRLSVKLTGKMANGDAAFPLMAGIELADDEHCRQLQLPLLGSDGEDTWKTAFFDVTICIFANVSGLMLMSEDGVIQTCNPTFINLLLGHRAADVVGQNVTMVIPGFYDELDIMEMSSRVMDDQNEHDCGLKLEKLELNASSSAELSRKAAVHITPGSTKSNFILTDRNTSSPAKHVQRRTSAKARLDFFNSQEPVTAPAPTDKCNAFNRNDLFEVHKKTSGDRISQKIITDTQTLPAYNEGLDKENWTPNCASSIFAAAAKDNNISEDILSTKIVTSTPSVPARSTKMAHIENNDPKSFLKEDEAPLIESECSLPFEFPEGSFFGLGLHTDGSEISIMYQV